jgi:hypothetical protein
VVKGKRADVYLEVRKRRGHIFFELNFDEIVIGWFSSKNVSGGSTPRPRWPPQPNLA